MTVTNFRTLKADIINSTILSTDFFAESVTYTPAGGSPRTITAKVTIRGETEYSDAGDESELELVRVFCRRDATEGILAPQIGDTLQRSASVESDNRPYTFHEELRGESLDSHIVALFARGKQTARSPNG